MAREDLEYRASLDDKVSPGFEAIARAAAEADEQLDKIAADARSLNRLEGAIDGLSKGVEKLANSSKDAKRTADAVDGIGFSLVKVNQALDLAGKGFALLGRVGDVFLDGIADARELENTIRGVGIVAGDTSKGGLAQLKKAAIDASGAFSANEAAQGLGELARAGLSAENSVKVLTTALNLALGQQVAVADAATLLTTNMTLFNIAAEDSARVADVFSKAADSTETDVQRLGLAMSYAAPLATQLGYSIEETTAILGLMAKNGLQGERAGTALRNVFSALLDPTSKFSAALRQAGINSTDFTEILAALEKQADGGREVLLALDAEARPAILGLAQLGSEALAKLNKEFEKSTGATQRASDAYREAYDIALNELVTAIENARIALTEPLLEAITDDVQALTAKIKELAESDSFQELARKIGEAADKAAEKFGKFVDSIDFDEAAERIGEFFDDFSGKADSFIRFLNTIATVSGRATDGVVYLAEGFGKLSAELTLWLEKAPGYKIASDAASAAARGFGDSNLAAARSLAEGARKTAELDKRIKALSDEGFVPATETAEELQRAIEGIAQKQREFEASAEPAVRSIKEIKEELQAAAAAGDDYNTTRLTKELARAEEQLKKTSTAAVGLTQQLQEAEAKLKKAIEGGNQAEIDTTLAKFKELRAEAKKNQDTFDQLTQSQEKAAKETTKAVQQVGQAQQQTAQVTEAAADQQAHAMAGVGAQARELANRIIALRQEFAAFGAETAGEFEKRLDAINNRFRGTGTSMANYIATLEGAAQRLRELIKVQDDQVKNLESGLSSAVLGVSAFGQSAEETLQRLQQLEAATYDTNGQFRLLSQQRLEALRSQIRSVTSAVQEQAAALEQLNRLAAAGDDRRLAELDFQQRLREIDELARRTGAAGAQAAAEARQAAEREHKRRLNEIRERAAADRQRYDDEDRLDQRNVDNARRRRSESAASEGSQTSSGARPGQTQKAGDTFNITVNNQQAVGFSETQLADALTTQITKRIERQALLRR